MWILALALSLSASPSAPKKPRLAVLDIQNLVGVSPELAQGMTAALVVAIRESAVDYSVISADEIKAMLQAERTKQQLGCVEASCLAEIGGALGAARMITGQLGKFGSTYLLTVKMVDVRQAQVLKEAAENLKAVHEDALLDAVKRVASRLFPRSVPASTDDGTGAPADLWAEAPSPAAAEGHGHGLGWTLVGVAVAAAVVSVIGFVNVASYNGEVSTWNSAVASGGPAGNTAAQIASATSSAGLMQVLGFAGAGLAVAAAGGAALAW